MTFLEELLKTAVMDGDITVNVSFEADDLVKIIEGKCYKMLSEIRDIIRDDSLDDPECFMKIDSIVSLFIREGISTNGRNDF
jgi:hypothetical protein